MEDKTMRDILVKLGSVFKKDFYIIDGGYIWEGEDSQLSNPGRYLCILEEKYKEKVKEIYGDHKCIFVSNVVLEKDDIGNHIKIKDAEYEKIKEKIRKMLESIDEQKEWKNFLTEFPDLPDVIYGRKNVFSIPVNDDKEVINIGKSMIPILTEKTIAKSEYSICFSDIKLYELFIKYKHTHFRLYMEYYAIPMENLEK